MEQIRAFIAIELPAQFKLGLKELQSMLKADNPAPAKWVNPEDCHLTLRFLGNIGANQIDDITQAMLTAAAETTTFDLKMGHIGTFPNTIRAQVIWVGLEGDLDELRKLKVRLDSALSPLGFPPEERTFTPHMTMARLRHHVSPSERERLVKLISNATPMVVSRMNVSSLSLMRSYLTREGAIHHRLSQATLRTDSAD